MDETKMILDAIQKLGDSMADRLDKMEDRLSGFERVSKQTVRAVSKNQEDIRELKIRMNELSKTDAIWRSQDGLQTGIEKDAAYNAFREMKIPRRNALSALDKAGVLVRGGDDQFTKPVRTSDHGVRRAIVIMEV